MPQPVRRGVGNFFGNFADAWSAINNLLQGKFEAGFEDVTRVGTNTLFGLFGILDVASEMGLDHHYEDFGQTLGRYGIGAGAYMVLPLLGPSTVRDAAAMPLDRLAAPPAFFDGTGTQVGLIVAADHQHARQPARRDAASSTTSRSTSTPSFATPTCSAGAAWSSTATCRRRRRRRSRRVGRRRRRRRQRRAAAAAPPASAHRARAGIGAGALSVSGRAQ